MASELTRNWWVLALRGVAAIVFGILFFLRPLQSLEILVILYGAFALVGGIFALVAAFARPHPQVPTWAMVLQGLAGIVVGVIAFGWTPIALVATIFLVGAWEIIHGLTTIIAAIQLRKEIQGEFWFILSGVVSVFFGIVIMSSPLLGGFMIGWMIGFYAIFLGGTLLALAFRIKNWHRDVPAAA